MKIKFNSKGFEEVLRSGPVADWVDAEAANVAARCGSDYVASGQQGATRYRAIVYPGTPEARRENRRDNILLKALGG